MTGLAAAFKKFGAKGKNSRWSWSARSSDDLTVVVTFWSDILKFEGGTVYYDTFGRNTGVWEARNGNRERIENLKWARDKCGGNLGVVITVAKDVGATPREIANCYDRKDIRMTLIELNELTGEFRAEGRL